ncbi:MAG: TlpA family protein disulfide reductase [Ilumatobacteraceae bacterium]
MTRPRRRAIHGILVAALGLGGGGCSARDDEGSADRLPQLVLPPLSGDGPALRLDALDGPAVVNLWATWCAPCRRELPAFQEVSEQHPDVAFVGVDVGEDAASAQEFLDRLGVTFPQYADGPSALADALGVASLPVTLVVDTDGRVVTNVGPMTAETLTAALAEAS